MYFPNEANSSCSVRRLLSSFEVSTAFVCQLFLRGILSCYKVIVETPGWLDDYHIRFQLLLYSFKTFVSLINLYIQICGREGTKYIYIYIYISFSLSLSPFPPSCFFNFTNVFPRTQLTYNALKCKLSP